MAQFFVWPALVPQSSIGRGFPFKPIQLDTPLLSSLVTSRGVAVIYLLGTVFMFRFVQFLLQLRIVKFFARHTLAIVIFRMPLYYATVEDINQLGHPWLKVDINICVCYVLLGVVGEMIDRVVQPGRLQSAYSRDSNQLFSRSRMPDIRPFPTVRIDGIPLPDCLSS